MSLRTNTKKNLGKNFLLASAFILSNFAFTNTSQAFGGPTLVNVDLINKENSNYTILVEINNNNDLYYDANSCNLNLFTKKESLWSLEQIKNKLKRSAIKTKMNNDNKGITFHYPCGSTINISDKEKSHIVEINIKTQNRFSPKSNTVRTSLRPKLRPTDLLIKNDKTEEQKYTNETPSLKTPLELTSSEETETVSVDSLNNQIPPGVSEDLVSKISEEHQKEVKTISETASTKTTPEDNQIEKNNSLINEETTENSSTVLSNDVTQKEDIDVSQMSKEELLLWYTNQQNEVEEIKEATLLPKNIDINSSLSGDFFEDKKLLDNFYITNVNNSELKNQAILALTEFYFSYQLLPEAASFINEFDFEKSDEQLALNANTLADVISVLQNKERELQVIGNPEYSQWEQYDLFSALHFINNEDKKNAKPLLKPASEYVENLDNRFVENILPTLLFGTIENNEWGAAQNLSKFIDKTKDKNSPWYQYALGLAAEKTNRITDAFDAYALATLGNDNYAQKARLKIIDIGLSTDTMPLSDAQVFLEKNITQWLGDEIEIEALEKLSNVYEMQDDYKSALKPLGEIIFKYPELENIEKYNNKASELLDKVYHTGDNGELPIDDFLETHELIRPIYNFFEGFDVYNEMYADKLAELGATLGASKEYDLLLQQLELLNEYEYLPEDNLRYYDILLKKAKSEIHGGRYPAAQQTLEKFNAAKVPELESRYNLLKANLNQSTGNENLIIDTLLGNEDADSLKLAGYTAWDSNDYLIAEEKLTNLLENHPNDFDLPSAIRLLISANNNENKTTVYNVISRFPELMDIPEWNQIAEGINIDPASLSILTKEAIQSRVDSGDATQTLVEETVNN